MTKERSPRTESRQEILVREVNEYIREKYPVKRSIVNNILERMREEYVSINRFAVVTRFVDLAIDFAKSHGMEKRPKNDDLPPWRTPEMLSAISKFEKEKDADIVKQLPLSRHLGILAIGEIAVIAKSTGQGWHIDKTAVEEHSNNLKKLIEFQQKLRKISNQL